MPTYGQIIATESTALRERLENGDAADPTALKRLIYYIDRAQKKGLDVVANRKDKQRCANRKLREGADYDALADAEELLSGGKGTPAVE